MKVHGGYGGHDGEPSEPSEFSSQPDELCLADYAERPLRLRGRPPMTGCQKLWTGIFYAQLAFQLIAGVALWQSESTAGLDVDTHECPEGFTRPDAHTSVAPCVTLWLNAKREECKARTSTPAVGLSDFQARLLQADEPEKSNKVFDVLARHSRLPATTIAVSSVLCVLVLFSLAFAAACVTWGMFAFNALLMLYCFYLTGNWMLLVAIAAIGILAFLRRADIQAAIVSMKVGSEALQATPLVFVLCAGVQLVWLLYALAFVWFTVVNANNSYVVGPDCELQESGILRVYLQVCPLLFIITTFYFRHIILAVTSMAVGAWCFPEEAASQGYSTSGAAMLGLELAFTTSCGSVFVASVVLGAVDYLRKKVLGGSMLWWCDPVACLTRMLWSCLESTIGSLTRFALIGHMFQGDGLCHVASITGDVLQRRLPGVIICGIVSEAITRELAMMGATAVGIFVWWWLDTKEENGFFSAVSWAANEWNESARNGDVSGANGFTDAFGGTHLVIVGLTLLMLWCVRNPVLCIILSFLVAALDINDGGTSAFLISVVLASFVAVIFNYFASVLEYATDTAYYCMVLGAEGSKRNVRLQPLQDVAQKRVEAEADADNGMSP